MAGTVPLSTKKQVMTLLEKRATTEWRSAVAASTRQVQHEAPEEVSRVKAFFQETAGRTTSVSSAAKKQLVLQGVLPGPSAKLVEKLSGTGASKAYRRPLAGALASVIKGEADEVVTSVVNKKPTEYGLLLQRLRQPDPNQWAAASLQKAITWAHKAGDSLDGQVATLSGLILEQLRKTTAFFLAAGKKASKVVAAYNRRTLKGLTRELREQRAFGEPRFYEGMTDREGKLLSDGMFLSFNADGEVLVVRIEEVKLESVGADAIPQLELDIDRIRKRGIRLADGRYFPPGPPEKIKFPPAPTGRRQAELVAYIEGAKPRDLQSPKDFKVTIAGVESAGVREFSLDVLMEWRRRLASTKVHP